MKTNFNLKPSQEYTNECSSNSIYLGIDIKYNKTLLKNKAF